MHHRFLRSTHSKPAFTGTTRGRASIPAALLFAWIAGCYGGGEGAQTLEPSIQGGMEDVSGFYTFVVDVGGSCSGTLVSNKHVLTAGHCTCKIAPVDDIEGITHRSSAADCALTKKVTLRADNVDDLTLSGTVTAHPDYFINLRPNSEGDLGVVESMADIALIELDEAVPLAYGFVPTSDQQPGLGAPVTIVGYGLDSCNEGAEFGTRRYGTNEISTISGNQEFLGIKETNGELAWSGDSGGPMFATIGNSLRVIGVASKASCNADSPNDVSVYTNVARYAEWIAAAIAGSQGGACGDFVCGVGETAELCCTDCGCPGGMACQQNECNPVSQCAPNSTCCDGSGTASPLGVNGPGCLQECMQCNGAGTCVSRPNGLACASGEGLCDGGGGCSVSTCGDGAGTIDVGEQCDGANLGGETCTSLGYSGGTLHCAPNCTLDTGQCTQEKCNNGVLDLGEQCDGDKLSGATCVSQGYSGGVLQCSNQCTFDTSGCMTVTCGNQEIEGIEQCDGTELGSVSCESLGYEGGTLACLNCSFDVSGCANESVVTTPGLGEWTPPFTAETNCTCEPGNEDCRTLYRGRVVSFQDNLATLDFEKADGSNPSATISYWVVVGDPAPSCLLVDMYKERTSGSWSSQDSVLTVGGVNVWPSLADYDQAPCGDSKYLFVITGGGDGNENARLWFQKQAIKFTKGC